MLKPIGFVAMIEVDEVKEKTKGGIILAVDQVMERNAQVIGTIVALGEDFAVAYKPATPQWGLKAGDKVIFAKHAGKWVKDPETDKEYLFVLDSDIVGKVEDASSVVASQEA